MSRIVLFICLFVCINCTQKSSLDDVIDLRNSYEESIIVTLDKPLFEGDEIPYSNFSFIQANSSGLYVTPSSPLDGATLFRYSLESGKEVSITPAILAGRGPSEIEEVHISSKTITGDSLLFSSPGQKTIIINKNGQIQQLDYGDQIVYNLGFTFSFNEGKLLTTLSGFMEGDKLFRIHDLKADTAWSVFSWRVPKGSEPSIRNEILGETPIKGGFAVAFIGDRKIYLLNDHGDVKKQIILGESDEIVVRKKSSAPDPNDMRTGAKPYITKMEYYQGLLLVLMDNEIWIIDHEKEQVVNKLQVRVDDSDENPALIDFSITEDYLYTRIGRKGIYFAETSEAWFR